MSGLLCLLDKITIIIEFLLVSRIAFHIFVSGIEKEYGFRKCRLTNNVLCVVYEHLVAAYSAFGE